MDASTPDPFGVVLCNPFKWDILCSFLTKNLVIFVFATTANRISFPNHRNRNVVGGKHNVLVHYLDVSAPDPSSAVLCNLFKWDILCSLKFSDQKSSCCFCALHNSEINFILQTQEQESCRRQVKCSTTLCGCLCTQTIWVLSSSSPSYEIFCRSFLIKILHNSEMNSKTYPYLLVD